MSDIDTLPLVSLTTALGTGLLIGLMYERRKRDDPAIIAGLRTHTLAALAGAVGLWIAMPVFLLMLFAIGTFSALGYLRSSKTDPGITSELALVFSALLGGLAIQAPAASGALAVLVAILVYAKPRLQHFTQQHISEREVADGLTLLAFALIILPLLPDRAIDPWGGLNLAVTSRTIGTPRLPVKQLRF
ncbi:MAG: MgtC/SapB family protein, partial [Pseudomonadota bacterium]|nr:MgtC/SapB family protein [Pseudomonadota bacterium]